MSEFKLIRTFLGEKNEKLFSKLPFSLYDKASPRFIFGHDPILQYLEGMFVLLQNDVPVGRFAIYENPNLTYLEQPTLTIGSYECVNDKTTAKILIGKAADMTKKMGFSWLIGPMEGSTWQNHRFSANNDFPNFFMEPFHHDYYNQQFIDSGFKSMANYVSNLDESTVFDPMMIRQKESEFIEKGATIRQLNLENLTVELTAIGALSIEGFSNNFLYTPITVIDFVKKYEKMKSYFNSDLTWIIENEKNEMHGFIFGIIDYLDPDKKTIIIKSIVRKKDSPFKGIGSYLSGKINMIAQQKGFTKVIHAFMIKENASQIISESLRVQSYKSYSLYALKV